MTLAEFNELNKNNKSQVSSKMKAQMIKADGKTYRSKKEYQRHCDLLLLEQAGEISELQDQIPYSLDINGEHICKYYLDFQYREKNGEMIYEDVKGRKGGNPYYIFSLKKKMMKAIHGIDILET